MKQKITIKEKNGVFTLYNTGKIQDSGYTSYDEAKEAAEAAGYEVIGGIVVPVPENSDKQPIVEGFTGGEWEWEQCRGNNRYEHYVFSRNGGNYGSYVIAQLGMNKEEKEPKEIKANAALIASAPILYRENKELREALQLLSKEVNISSLKLNVKNNFSLLNAKANADKLLTRINTNKLI